MQQHGIPTQTSAKTETITYHYSNGSKINSNNTVRDKQHHGIPTQNTETRTYHYSKGSGIGAKNTGRNMQQHGIPTQTTTKTTIYSDMDSEITMNTSNNRFRLTNSNNSNSNQKSRIYGKGGQE